MTHEFQCFYSGAVKAQPLPGWLFSVQCFCVCCLDLEWDWLDYLSLCHFLSAACNPNLCRAKGRGLQPKGLRVKETADFKVYTKGAGTGELKVTIKGPSEFHDLTCGTTAEVTSG